MCQSDSPHSYGYRERCMRGIDLGKCGRMLVVSGVDSDTTRAVLDGSVIGWRGFI